MDYPIAKLKIQNTKQRNFPKKRKRNLKHDKKRLRGYTQKKEIIDWRREKSIKETTQDS